MAFYACSAPTVRRAVKDRRIPKPLKHLVPPSQGDVHTDAITGSRRGLTMSVGIYSKPFGQVFRDSWNSAVVRGK